MALAAASNATAAASTAALLLHLHPRRTLLVLDNCEHVLPAVQQLMAALLAQTAGVSVPATSRQALELTGVRVFALRPLANATTWWLPRPTSARLCWPASSAVRLRAAS